jgi:large subunit ribosomal protein L6
MSRVGKMPVTVPAGVDVSIKEDQINVKGSGGTLSLTLNVLVNIKNDAGKLTFEPANDSREANAMSGTMRQLVNNMVVGVTKGFEKKLSLVGAEFDGGLFAPREQRHARWHHGGNPDPDGSRDQGC